MTELNEIPDIVRKRFFHKSSKFKELDTFGTFTNSLNNSKKSIIHGSVYGFFVKLTTKEREQLFEEANSKGTLKIKSIEEFKPIDSDIYPLYWGKDKRLGSRIYAHIKNPEGAEVAGKDGTGLIRLEAYSTLHEKEIGVLVFVVNDNKNFETEIQKAYPSLLNTSNCKL